MPWEECYSVVQSFVHHKQTIVQQDGLRPGTQQLMNTFLMNTFLKCV